MASTDFDDVLSKEIKSRKQTRRAKKVLALLDGPKTKIRERRLKRLQAHAIVVLGLQDKDPAEIDWSAIDWNKLFETLLSFILKIIDLI